MQQKYNDTHLEVLNSRKSPPFQRFFPDESGQPIAKSRYICYNMIGYSSRRFIDLQLFMETHQSGRFGVFFYSNGKSRMNRN